MLKYVSLIFFILSPLLSSAQGYFYTESIVQVNAGAAIEIKGNAVINQSITGNGYMVMNGDNPQNIGGTSANMNNLKVTNGADAMLVDPVWVNDTLNMFSGILYLQDNPLFLADDAAFTGNAAGFVQTDDIGYVQRKIDPTPFTFHMGHGTEYFPFTVSESGTIDTFKLQAWDFLPDDGTLIGNPINSHVALLSYRFTDLVSGGNNLNISMNWSDNENAIDFVQTHAVGIWYDGANYVELSNCPTNVNSINPNIVSYSAITNTGTFGIGDSMYLTTVPHALVTPGDTSICSGNSVVYTATPAGAAAYLWNTGQVISSINASVAMDYYVTITDANGCDYTSDAVTLTILPLPTTPTITVTDTVLSVPAIYATYQWYLNGTPIGGANNSSYSVNGNGTYSVVVSGANGCTNTSSNYVFNNFGLEDENISMHIFQQNEQLVIQLEGDDAQQVLVYDALGKVVFHQIYTTNIISLHLSHGMYVIRVMGLKKEYVKKMIW
jgi:hypothetical protein